MIREYITQLSNELNNQYPGILNQDKINRAIEMFENSAKGYDEVVEEIEISKNQMISDYLNNRDESNKVWYYDNAQEDERESRTFSQIKEVQSKVQELLNQYNLKIYISGGSVPYLLQNEDSGRLHDDIDTICKRNDIDKLRQVFIDVGLYNQEWDSKNFSDDGKDYGFEMKIDGVPFGIFPFEYDEDSKTIIQYSADPYMKVCKTKTIPIQEISDYIMTYRGLDGKVYDTMSLEYIKLTKDNAGRPKDVIDSKKIEETGLLRKDIMDRVQMYSEYINTKEGFSLDNNQGRFK